MGMIYFPSCKFTAKYPDISEAIKRYVTDRHGADVAGCCKASLKRIGEDDVVVYICNTCAAFFKESTPARRIVSIWELLLDDPAFLFSPQHNKQVTVQDCWRTRDNPDQQWAVRQILRNMGVDVVEQAERGERTTFCGYSLYDPLPAGYNTLAPRRFGEEAKGLFAAHTEAEKTALMKAHCSGIATPEVVCYCVACVGGIDLGGKRGVHLSELVFGGCCA